MNFHNSFEFLKYYTVFKLNYNNLLYSIYIFSTCYAIGFKQQLKEWKSNHSDDFIYFQMKHDSSDNLPFTIFIISESDMLYFIFSERFLLYMSLSADDISFII